MALAGATWAKEPAAKPPVEPAPGSLAYLDAKNGFRDVRFGSVPTKDMELAGVDGEEKIYIRPTDSLEIGGGTCEKILYVFHAGHLRAVSVTTEGWKNNRAIRESLHAAYGAPSVPSEYGGRERWIGNRVVAEYSENRDGGAVTYFRAKSSADNTDEDGKDKAKTERGVHGL